MTRHGKGTSGQKFSGYTHYRRKVKGLDTGGSGGGGIAGAKATWFEVKKPDGKVITVDYKPGNSHHYS